VNLLREEWTPTEVSLVAILDADKEGSFARDLAYTDNRPGGAQCRGEVILYADKCPGTVKRAVDETERRRSCRWKTINSRALSETVVPRDQNILRLPGNNGLELGPVGGSKSEMAKID
jgi:excinuclease UvrABC helicase subunit UvrB